MTNEQITTILSALKIDLGITTTSYDSRLSQIIQASAESIISEGVSTLNPEVLGDAQLVIMYAAWTWRRRDTGIETPRMLRWSLNNRIMKEKAR